MPSPNALSARAIAGGGFDPQLHVGTPKVHIGAGKFFQLEPTRNGGTTYVTVLTLPFSNSTAIEESNQWNGLKRTRAYTKP